MMHTARVSLVYRRNGCWYEQIFWRNTLSLRSEYKYASSIFVRRNLFDGSYEYKILTTKLTYCNVASNIQTHVSL